MRSCASVEDQPRNFENALETGVPRKTYGNVGRVGNQQKNFLNVNYYMVGILVMMMMVVAGNC